MRSLAIPQRARGQAAVSGAGRCTVSDVSWWRMASHGAGEQLLEQGLLVVVAPGGMKEALRPREERYQVKWSDRKGFVRLALRTGAPLVMAACPKADDLYDVVDSDLTRRIYDQFHLPIPMLRGEGPGGLLPRR